MPQFLYDKNGKPLLAPPAPSSTEPTGVPNDKCPTCGNLYTFDLPTRNTSGRSKITTKKVRCNDCDTTFHVDLENPIPQSYKKPPKLGDFRKK